MTIKELERHYKSHQDKVNSHWDECRARIYQEFLAQGYLPMWAEEKAKREVLELRSRAENPCNMTIPEEFTKNGDLD